MSARRAIIHWAVRLVRREWRRQLLVLSLLTVAVTVAVCGASAAQGLVPAQHAAEFGTANMAFRFGGSEVAELDDALRRIRQEYGQTDVISRRQIPVPGAARLVEFRAQDPAGPYAGPMLDLREGRYPRTAGETAVTPEVARLFDLRPGSRFTLDDVAWNVVGLVENPSNLADHFALVAPQHANPPHAVTVLVRGQPGPLAGEDGFDVAIAGQELGEIQVMAAVIALVAGTVAMVLVALVAAAGFAVIGRRRQRQLGMLAAIGATERQLRLVMVTNGAVVGAVAALAGTATGLLGWLVAAPYLEPMVGARIDRLQILPWWLLGTAMAVCVLVSTAAAWWPARTLARIPITHALSGRPSAPAPVRASIAVAAILLVAGVSALAAVDTTGEGWAPPLLVAGGTLAVVCGLLALSPLIIRAVGARVGRAPVAVRLAVRDLARHQSRSGAALAAIGLALGCAAAVIVAVGVAERDASSGNLSERQLLITKEGNRIRELVTVRTPQEIEELRARVGQITATLDDPVVIELQQVVDPDEPARPGRDNSMRNSWRHAVLIGDGPRTARPGPLFVATPELLRHYGVDPAGLDPRTEILTIREGEVGLRHLIDEELVREVERLDVPPYTMAPTSLITPAAVARRGWTGAFAGFLVESRSPLTSAEVGRALATAGGSELLVMARDVTGLAELRSARSGVVAVAGLVALCVLALSVGLIRGESAADLRTLAATGATGRTRRTITAATVGTLAGLGVLLGVAGAYLGVAAVNFGDFEVLLPIPAGQLLALGVGLPAVATAGAWLLAGREPPVIARRVLE